MNDSDGSQKASVDAGLAQIRHTLPPIGGIAYGPLVLHDTLFRTMDISMMDVVLKAKVVGARLLHERFSDPAVNPLDFFVMCSSAATTGGNPGQANYNAANSYLQALAQQRRSAGLAVSGDAQSRLQKVRLLIQWVSPCQGISHPHRRCHRNWSSSHARGKVRAAVCV